MTPEQDAITEVKDAVIVAGGRARRLDGADKAALRVGGETLLDRALRAVGDARTVVVGPPRTGMPPDVLVVREEPAFSGPAAAVAAGLRALHADGPDHRTAVLSVDLVRPAAALEALLSAVEDEQAVDGWVARDESGHRQPLLAVYRTAALRDACAAAARSTGALENVSMQVVLEPLLLRDVPLPDALCADVDDPDDLARARSDHGAVTMVGGPR
ncbi:molybdenum cofactor guanylyltransferase [Curtobacterium sp. 22159]|uniref:molybdenum cofactor guanylyltransferase n=1 Tax=Curtobacterium sp. 22159 TaxID=3453882 RepID=UPI003F867972